MYMLEISSVCSDPALGGVLNVVKNVFNFIELITPIVLIVMLLIRFYNMINNPDEKKNLSKLKNSITASVVVFMVPVLANIVMSLLGESTTISACWNSDFNGYGDQYIELDGSKKSGLLIDPSEFETGEKPKDMSGTNSVSPNGTSTNSTGSHVSSKSNIEFNIYYQNDSKWGSTVYPGSSSTISGIGCAITSVAVTSSAYDFSITPLTVFNSYRYNNPRDSIPKLTNGAFQCRAGSTSKENIVSALNSGEVVVVTVYGKKKGGSSKFTSSQHYMALIDINSDSIFVGNGYSSSAHGKAGWFNIDDVLTSVKLADYCTPSSSLKK